MFFEIGVVLLVPVIFLVARRSGCTLMKIGIPALAGLSVMHGLVPPHPGPLVAIAALNANLGITLALRRPHRHPDGDRRRPACSPATPPAEGRRPTPHLFDDEADRGDHRPGAPDRRRDRREQRCGHPRSEPAHRSTRPTFA